MLPRSRATNLVLASLGVALWALGPASGGAETLTLRRQFVDEFKDRATISVQLEVDAHLNTPHSISKGGDDGDIHMAGRADEVGLPLVAEIVNAARESAAVDLLRKAAAGTRIPVTGAWRIWFEHLGKEPQIQGKEVQVPSTSNPDHLFEIHPITAFGGLDLAKDSLQPIPGYEAYPAATAFGFYESVPASVQANATAVMIESGEGKYNYAEFYIELAGKPQDVGDGYLVLAEVYSDTSSEAPLTSAPRRMVFVKGSGPANQVQQLGPGGRLHVLGIPRVNLNEVETIATAQPDSDPVQVHLPYEMIIVAVLP